MASSSVSQESLDTEDFAISVRKSKIRTMRARGLNPLPRCTDREREDDPYERDSRFDEDEDTPGWGVSGVIPEHESPSRSTPASRAKDKRTRPNHLHKGKLPKDKRKLREKRRSTGVGLGGLAHLPSTESTGDSLDEDDEDPTTETKRNTSYNEIIDEDNPQTPSDDHRIPKGFISRRTKSPSDLEADLEDNQDYDSTVSQSETNLTLIGKSDSTESNHVHSPKLRQGRGVFIPSSQHKSPDPSKPYSCTNTTDPPSSSPNNLLGRQSKYGVATNVARWRETEMNSLDTLPVIRPLTSSVLNKYQEHKSDNSHYSGHHPRENVQGSGIGHVGHHTRENVQGSGVGHRPLLNQSPQADEALKLEQLLEREKEENRKLKEIIETKDKKIAELEKEVSSLNKDLEDFDDENQKLVLENNSLIRAVSHLSITSTAV